MVNTPQELVNGIGHITQATNPPLNLNTQLQGTYTYMATMSSVNILVVLTGYPVANLPPNGGVGPVLMPNVQLRMVLSQDWKTGTANYKYVDNSGQWKEMDNVPVKLLNSPIE